MPKLVLLVLAFLALLTFVFFSPIFKIKKLELSSQDCLTQEKLTDEIRVLGKSMLFVSESKLQNEIKLKYSCVDYAKITKKLPSTLIIDIKAQTTVFKIENTNYFLTKEALVVEGSYTQTPKIYLPNNPQLTLGQKISDDLVINALKIGFELLKSDFTLIDLRILSESEIVAYDTRGLIAVFAANKDSKSQVDSLQLVLSAAKIDGTKIAKIDLRFDKPVIVYK